LPKSLLGKVWFRSQFPDKLAMKVNGLIPIAVVRKAIESARFQFRHSGKNSQYWEGGRNAIKLIEELLSEFLDKDSNEMEE